MANRKELERAIEHIADNVRFLRTHSYTDNSLQHHELALVALKEKLSRQENAPLTIDEIESMNGRSLFVVFIDSEGDAYKGWFIVDVDDDSTTLIGAKYNLYIRTRGKADMHHLTAYRYEPKGEKA